MTLTLEERFWSKVDVRDPDDCWPWIRSTYRNGYGSFTIKPGQFKIPGAHATGAHRVAYILTFGMPKGVVDHECHNRETSCPGGWNCLHRLCCNPAHLRDVTQRTNLLDGDTVVSKFASRTHCANGHEYTEENTRIYRGYRDCRACGRERQAERRRRHAPT